MEELYSQIAPLWSGWLERSEYMWRRVFEPFNQTPFGYVVGPPGDVEGYLIGYYKHDGPDYNLILTDLQARTCEALDNLLSLLAGYRSTVQHVEWHCGALDATLLRFPDKAVRLQAERHWMLRIVDVERALLERGYAVGVDTELHLDVRDELLPANHGRYVLRVRQTKAEVERGGRGDLRLSVRTLSPLYSGFMSPWALRQAGLIEAEAPVLSAAASLFSTGGQPCMLDMF
jgi:predicted acetyltransferase